MPIRRRHLTAYHIRQALDGRPVTDFGQMLRDPASLQTFDWAGSDTFDARLYLAISNPRNPSWLSFLEEGFGDLAVPASQRLDAILAVRVSYYRRDHFFAFAFGHGRHLLRPDSYDRGYGLRVALNVIYNAEDQLPDRLRSVDSTTVAANTIRTRRQVDRRADFETFGVDIQRDLLKAVTGAPVTSDVWGTRISGSDAFNANPELDFPGLGDYCVNVLRTHRRDTYKRDFEWIDNLAVVMDPDVLGTLHDDLLDRIRDDKGYSLAVPELVEWDTVDSFSFSFLPENRFIDPEDADLDAAMQEADKADQLSIDTLKRWRLEAFDASGDRVHSWSLLTCLSAEVTLQGGTFILSEGEYFRVRQAFLEDLDGFIAGLPQTAHVLPESVGDVNEGPYNELAAESSSDYLLLDKRTVRVGGVTSPIEICDVLAADGSFIHIKRKLGSSSLSHLFAQGTVSADLFLTSREYREATSEVIRAQESARANSTGDDAFVGRFSGFDIDGIRSADYVVVYGIIANWGDRSVAEALPFFSKVNLRRHAVDLHRMGYRVELARIMVA